MERMICVLQNPVKFILNSNLNLILDEGMNDICER